MSATCASVCDSGLARRSVNVISALDWARHASDQKGTCEGEARCRRDGAVCGTHLGSFALGEELLERDHAALQFSVRLAPFAHAVAANRRGSGRRAHAVSQPCHRFRRRFGRAAFQQRAIQRPFCDLFVFFEQHQSGL